MGQVTITLNGRTYRLKCGDGEEGRLLDLSGHVGGHIDRLVAEFGQIGDDRLLLMASLFIADELWDARARLEAVIAENEHLRAPRLPHEAPSPDQQEPPLLGLPDAPPAPLPEAAAWAEPAISDSTPEPVADASPPEPFSPPPEKPSRHGSLEQRIAEARARAASEPQRRFDET